MGERILKIVMSLLVVWMSLMTINKATAQNYVLLPDASGFDRSGYVGELSTGADDLISIISDIESSYSVNFSQNIKFYETGFYLHNDDMQGIDPLLTQTIASIPSNFYVLFAKESNDAGIHSKVHIKVNFGDSGCTGYTTTNFESILESVFNEEYKSNPFNYANAVDAVYEKLLCLLPEYWYSCLQSNLTSDANKKSNNEGPLCDICDVQVLKGYKFLEIPITLSSMPDDPSGQNPTLKEDIFKNNQSSLFDGLGVNISIPGLGTVDLASIISQTSFSSTETLITYHCLDFQDALANKWNLVSGITWIHIDLEDGLSGTMYFGSSVTAGAENTDYALSHYFDFWNTNNIDTEEHFMATSECSYYSTQFFDSDCAEDWLSWIQELLGCADFGPYQKNGKNAGIIPLCFWEDTNVPVPGYYSAIDIPFAAGIADGAYTEIEGLLTFVTGSLRFVDALLSYPACWILDEITDSEYYNYIDSAFQTYYPDSYELLQTNFNYLKNYFLTLGFESCEQKKERLKKFYTTIQDIYSFFSKTGFLEILNQAMEALNKYYNSINGLDNMHRYRQGRLVFGIASVFIPAGTVGKSLKGLSDALTSFTKKLDGFFSGKVDDIGEVITDEFADGMKYLKTKNPSVRNALETDLTDGPKEFLEFIATKGEDGVKAWDLVKHLDEGVRLNVNALGKLDNLLTSGKIPKAKLESALNSHLGDILNAADEVNVGKILDRLNLQHVDELHFDNIIQRLDNYPTLRQDLIDNPDWFDTFDDILKRPGDYWDIVDEAVASSDAALIKWGQGFWWKNLREKAKNFEIPDPSVPGSGTARSSFRSSNNLNANQVVDQVTLEVNGTKIRIDYLGKDASGQFHLGDAKFSTKDKNWSSEWSGSSTPNQSTVFPDIQSQSHSIVIKATDPDKIDAIESAFNITMNNGTFTIPVADVGSLKIFGSAADDISVVKEVVELL